MISYGDVLVVGAGPVGLLTAIELTLGGARVLVLERLAAPSMISKALSIGPLGIEALQRRGMAAAVAAAEGRTFAAMRQFTELDGVNGRGRGPRYTGHFAGLILIRADAQKQPERYGRPVDQQSAEAMLADRARSRNRGAPRV
jgi:2-polyprenyl-6-methoxyphenol hydroxylase-like FAD-dependent oxidoreductase